MAALFCSVVAPLRGFSERYEANLLNIPMFIIS